MSADMWRGKYNPDWHDSVGVRAWCRCVSWCSEVALCDCCELRAAIAPHIGQHMWECDCCEAVLAALSGALDGEQ